MNRKLQATLVASVIGTAGAVFGLAQPASAACNIIAHGASTWTEAYPSGCPSGVYAQARIDRYVSSQVKIYTGSMSTYSYVSNSSGTNAGNGYRWKAQNGTVSAWQWL